MIYFHTALFYEAAAVIARYKMKKLSGIHAFQVFQDRDKHTLLIVSGTGPINGSVSVAFLLAVFPPADGDIFVNLGVCAGGTNFSEGDVILCNQIMDGVTGRMLYPEMNYQHTFIEGSLYSSGQVVSIEHRRQEDLQSIEEETHGMDLADMEGAFVFQAAAKLMPLDRIFIIKVLSDHYTPQNVTRVTIERLIQEGLAQIGSWLEVIDRTSVCGRFQFDAYETSLLERVGEGMRLTVSMRKQLEKHCRYLKLTGNRIIEILDRYAGIECGSKREGKLLYEQLIIALGRTE